jgi:hypothetical protein
MQDLQQPTQVRYTYGYNLNASGQWSVVKVTDEDTGDSEVVLSSDNLTQAKVQAIAMILNAPELH